MDKFCMAPWAAISTDVNGSIRPCCRFSQPHKQIDHVMPFMKDGTLDELWNSEPLRKLRQSFIDGEMPIECIQCSKEESSGLVSYRQEMNTFLERYPHQKNRYDFTSAESPSPFYIYLKLTNVCNLKCRMCSPMASSLIQKEREKEFGIKGDDYWHENKIVETYNEESFKRWLPNIDYIVFTGGEPFVGKENKDLIQLMIDEGHSHKIDLHFNTNGMVMPKAIIDMLLKFRSVSLAFSVDDIGKRLNYHRHGADWELIKKNIQRVPTDKNITIAIYTTVNNYNIWYLEEAMEEFKKLTKNVSYDFVYEPAFLSPRCLNSLVKKELIEKYDGKREYEKVIKYIKDSNVDRTMEFFAQIRELDKIRKENFAEVFPEWAEVIMYYE
jgi:sulfatase maturation enzyme AslB (radical SAM superfamily)